MALSANEQLMLELINRARLDPLAEAARYALPLNSALSPGSISVSAKQVLAPNEILQRASEGHSSWMLAQNVFSHTGSDQSSPGDRMVAAGYDFKGQWSWRENLAWSGTTGTLDLQAAILSHHEQLYRSESHRVNTFATEVREIGVAQVEGSFESSGTTFDASMLTLNFATTGANSFLTGVMYQDLDGDQFYDVGEGRGGLNISIGDRSVSTGSNGGYSLEGRPMAATAVALELGGLTIAELTVDLDSENAKLDYVVETDGSDWLYVSQDVDLVAGIGNARLLGNSNLNLSGSDADNTLIGNSGRNTLSGDAGDDQIYGGTGRDPIGATEAEVSNSDMLLGGSGNDILNGQSGDDSLYGGVGNDLLSGGGGRDTFIFASGEDTVLDFAANVDRLVLDLEAFGLTDMEKAQLNSFTTTQNGDLTMQFDVSNSLTLTGIGSIDEIWNDISIA